MKILVSSAGGKVPLIHAVKSAASKFQQGIVVAGDIDPWAVAQYVADEFWVMPIACDENIETILTGLVSRDIKYVLPTRDGELLFWAKHRQALSKAGISVIISNLNSINLCLDKLSFAKFGIDNNLPFIPTTEHIEDITKNRLVVKERFGSGSRSIGINLNKDDARQFAQKLDKPIFQPMVDGMEISIDAWLNSACKLKGMVLRRRDVVVNGESRITTTFSDAKIELIVSRILELLEVSGPVVMQAFIRDDGELLVIECNPRIGGASTLGIAAGVSSLHWSLLEMSGANLDDWPFLRRQDQLRQIRVAHDIYITDSDIRSG